MIEQTLECAPICLDRASLRRQKIISSARQLFMQKGFHATGVAQIAKESGVVVGQIYRDFASKEDIIAAIVHHDCSDFLEAESLQRHIESGEKDLIWTWVANFLNSKDADSMLSEILAEAGRNERVANIFRKMHNEVFATTLRALEALAPGAALEGRRMQLASLILTMSLGFIQTRLIQSKSQAARECELAMQMLQAEVSALQQHPHADARTERGQLNDNAHVASIS